MTRQIPAIFHRIWFGPREMPARYADYGRSWRIRNAGWLLWEHSYDDLPTPMVNQVCFDLAAERPAPTGGAKRDSIVQVQQADIASYEILWRYGGVYLNCDMEARRPLGNLLEHTTCAIAWEMDGEYPSNAWMAATPNHPFIGCVLDLLPDRMRQYGDFPVNEQTGPHLLRQALREYGGDDVTMIPSAVLMPFDFNHLDQADADFPDAIAVHHWGHRIPDHDLWGDD